MKKNYRYEQEKNSIKKEEKQECIEYIIELGYGATIPHQTLAKILKYNLYDEIEYKQYRGMMILINKILIDYGYILRSIPNVGFYVLKPSQVSNYVYRGYIKRANRLCNKSEYVLEKTDKTDLNKDRKEEIENLLEMNKQLINNMQKTITESTYFSRMDYYNSLKD